MKKCPVCDHENIDDAEYCSNCGFEFVKPKSTTETTSSLPEKLLSPNIFIVLIAAVLIIGGLIIFTTSFNTHSDNTQTVIENTTANNDFEIVITESYAQKNTYSDSQDDYEIYTYAYFNNPPSDPDILVKTTYLDKNNNTIGQETEKLSVVLDDLNEGIDGTYRFGDYSAYEKFYPHTTIVEIIDHGNVIANATTIIDEKTIDYLNED